MSADSERLPELLRMLRVAAGLSQEELAERAEMTSRAIGDLERGAVRRPRRGTVQRLIVALGLTGARAEAFAAVARGGTAPAPGSAPRPAQLPRDVEDFVGRDREVADIVSDLCGRAPRGTGAAPVLGVHGPPGVGKTALAVHIGHQVRRAFPDGQLFADLRGASPAGRRARTPSSPGFSGLWASTPRRCRTSPTSGPRCSGRRRPTARS